MWDLVAGLPNHSVYLHKMYAYTYRMHKITDNHAALTRREITVGVAWTERLRLTLSAAYKEVP